MTTTLRQTGGVGSLAAVFAALLAGCTGRGLPGEGETDGGSGTTGGEQVTDPTTGPGGVSEPGTASASESASGSASESASGSASDSESASEPPDETSTAECVYERHAIELTPEEYQGWLDGEMPGVTTGTTGDPDPGGSSTSTAGPDGTTTDTTGETSGAGETSGTDTGTTGEGMWSFELCAEICAALTGADRWRIETCEQTGVDEQGDVHIECVELIQDCEGRRHACITSRGDRRSADPVADHFARAAHDEAASVYAFAALGAELAAFGAPAELLARVEAAAADEVRHAQAVSTLAAARGGRCRPPARAPVATRSLLAVALENAVEGCVRETWAALQAAHQAAHAADPQVRAVMREIAGDEARHAELAWAIDAWLLAALDPGDRAAVEAARAAAADSLVAGVAATTPAPALVHTAGVPDRDSAGRLVRGLAAALWAA